MSVTDEDLTAYADGELTGADAERVAAAIAADPALAARLDAEKRLRALLGGHFDPVMTEPVPESLTLMIAAAAADDAEREMIDTPAPPVEPHEPARILDFAAARARRDAEAKAATPPLRLSPRWGAGAAIAASLVLGLIVGTQMPREGARTTQDGALVATGSLARGLEGRLAADDTPGDLRVLTSFRRNGGDYCRVYEARATSGIACKGDEGWTLERVQATGKREAGEYRQAGSAQADLMTAAQAMASGEPLDAQQERAARAVGWAK